MEGVDQERLWLARDVARALARTLEASKRATTPGGNDPKNEVSRLLRGFVRRHGRFQLRASSSGVSLGGQALPDEQGKFAALGTDLVLGGIRELVVEDGLTAEEVVRLLEALDPSQEDAATRVLEAGLDHVEVRSLEWTSGVRRPDGYSPEARARLQEQQKRAEELVARLEARGQVGQGQVAWEISDSGGEFERLERVPAPRVPALTGGLDPAEGIDPEALASFRARALEAASPDQVLLGLVDAALQGFALDPHALGVENARWFLELAPDRAIQEGDLALLAGILDRYAMELTVSGGPVAACIEGVLKKMGEKQRLEKIMAIAAGGAEPDAFCSVLESLGEQGVSAALGTWQRTSSKELKELLVRFLSENIAQQPDALRPLLAPGVPGETAKFALFLVSRALEDDAADALFRAGRAHSDPTVAEYAAFLGRTHTRKGRLAALDEALAGNDVAARIAAVRAVGKARDTAVLEQLLTLVQDPSFLARSSEEMTAFLDAIAEIGGPATIRFFQEQSERSSGVFRIRAGTEVRGKAKEILKRLGEEGK